MKTSLKKLSLAAALLASTALVAPGVVYADADLSGTNNAATTYVAPIADHGALGAVATPRLGPGMKVRFYVAATDPLALGDNDGNGDDDINLYAILLKADGSYYGKKLLATAAGGAALDLTGTLPAGSYTQVAFVLEAQGDEDDFDAGDGTGTTIAYISPNSIVNTGAFNLTAGVTFDAVVLTGATASATFATGPTKTEALALIALLAAIDDDGDGNPPYIAVDSTYAGPLATSATEASDASALVVAFDMPLTNDPDAADALGGDFVDDDVVDDITLGSGAEANYFADATFINTAGSMVLRFTEDAEADFGSSVESVTVAGQGTFIYDFAGNPAAEATPTLTEDAPPAYADGTAVAVLTDADGDAANGDVEDLYDTGLGEDDEVTVRVRFAASVVAGGALTVGDAADGTEDIVVAPADAFDTFVASMATDGNAGIDVDLTLDAGYNLRVADTGQIYVVADADNDDWDPADPTTGGEALTVAVGVVDTNELQSLMGSVTEGLDATPVYAGVAQAPTLVTRDDDEDGTVDGVTIDFHQAINASLPDVDGLALIDREDDTVEIDANVAAVADSETESEVSVVADDVADLEELITGDETLGTDATDADLPFDVTMTDSEILYQNVYSATTGEPAKVMDVVEDIAAASATIDDGASPVILSAVYHPVEVEAGVTPTSGYLVINVSEPIDEDEESTFGDYKFAASPLDLLNLNDETEFDPEEDDLIAAVADDNGEDTIIQIGDADNAVVSSAVAAKAITLKETGFVDLTDDANALVTDGTVIVSTGTTVTSGPQIVQAIGTRSAGAVDGNIDTVLVKFDKGVQLATGGAKEDGMFVVRAYFDDVGYDIEVPAANIDLAAASTGYVTLSIPSPYIKGTLESLFVEYNDGVDDADNRLVSTDATPADIADDPDGNFSGTDDDASGEVDAGEIDNDVDTAEATFPDNTHKLYSMELKGFLTTNGTTALPKGTILRADLVDFGESVDIKGFTVNVPCDCTNGAAVSVDTGEDIDDDGVGADVDEDGEGFAALEEKITQDRRLQKKKTRAWLTVGLESQTGAVNTVVLDVSEQPNGGSNMRVYEIEVDVTTGAVVGVGSGSKLTGQAVLQPKPQLMVLDTVWQVTNDGKFRTAVGTDSQPKNGFILASVKLPDEDFFQAITSPVRAFANHVPFASNVVSSGVLSGDVGTVDLSRINHTSLDDSESWQLVGFQDNFAFTTDPVRKAIPILMERLFVTVDGTNGAPATSWSFDEADDNDEMFLLINNTSISALEFNDTTVDGSTASKQLNGGLAMALKNESGNYVSDDGTDNDVVLDSPWGIFEDEQPFTIYYPVNGPSADFKAEAGKWSLLTMEADVGSIPTWADTNKIGAIIIVGSDEHQKAWFKGTHTDNTLSALSKGDRVFIYFDGANAAFKYGRS